MPGDPADLTEPFPPPSEAAWMALVEMALKGRPFDTLRTRTEDGTVLEPLYPAAPDATPTGRPFEGAWDVVTRVDGLDPEAAATQALEDLENGATGLAVVLPQAPTAWGTGVPVFDLAALDKALAGVLIDLVSIRLEGGAAGRGLLALTVALVERRGLDPAQVRLHAGLDPLGAFAAAGTLSAPWEDVGRRLADTFKAYAAAGFKGSLATADGRPFHAGGATDATELAIILANAVAVLRALEAGGIDPAEAAHRIGFAIAVDQDQFAAVAKVRALRRLWASLLAASALPAVPAHIHAETAFRMLTARDPHTNHLRTTIATFAAGVGGADSVTVLPFTQPLGVPDGFARRIARNTQTILLEESHLAAVIDPAAGSGAVTARTESLEAAAWEAFRDIERAGGLAAAIASGSITAKIAKERAARAKDVATRKRPIVGTSQYPDSAERPIAVTPFPTPATPVRAGIDVAPAPEGDGSGFQALRTAAASGATLADLAAAAPGRGGASPIGITPLDMSRIASPFEALRSAADAAAERGEAPRVLLVTLGPPARHTARMDFAANLLAAGGIATALTGRVDSAAAAATAFSEDPATHAVLCGDDETYEALAADVARALTKAGAKGLYLAGRRGPLGDTLEEAGVARFLHMGMDVVDALKAIHGDLGVAADDPEAPADHR